MKIKININGEYIPATLEVLDGVMIVSPKEEKVELKWKPKYDEFYCRPMFNDVEFVCRKDQWDNVKYENVLYDKGWVFKTKQECQAFCDKLNQAIKDVKP